MRGRVGVPTHIRRVVSSAFSSLPAPPNLSKTAKLRLSWLDYYRHTSDASLTCRHFGISRSLFYKWKQRYDRFGSRGLEDRTKRPKAVRAPVTPSAHVDLIRKLRRAHPEYSKYKLRVILERDHGVILSASTIGRIISRYNLFFARPVHAKGHPYRRLNRPKLPAHLKGLKPGELIEVDVKHLPTLGGKRYAFVAIDRATRQASVHVSGSITSRQGAVAWEKAVVRLGLGDPAVLTDHGSENLGAFMDLLKNTKVPHYFARPHTPKDKPYVERFIGTLEREFIQWGNVSYNVTEQQALVDTWLEGYHDYRPHQALGYLTPNAYAKKLEAEVSTMS